MTQGQRSGLTDFQGPGGSGLGEGSTTAHANFDAAFMQRICGDEEVIVSHQGSSQYVGGGVSACGLAAMNCVRLTFDKAMNGFGGEDLLQDLTTQKCVEDVLSICTAWTGSAHLEVEDILHSPYFEATLSSVGTYFSHPSTPKFRNLLRQLQQASSKSGVVAAVVTRPPEIIAILKISTSFGDVFVIFDSHPRPAYPTGAAFIFNSSIDDIAKRLADLMAVDGRIFEDRDLQWQTQLLHQFSGIVIVPKEASVPTPEDLLQWSLALLKSKADAAEASQDLTTVTEERDSLMRRNDRLAAELTAMRVELNEERTRRQESWFSWPSSSSGKNKASATTSPRAHGSNYAAPRSATGPQNASPVAATRSWYSQRPQQNAEAGPSRQTLGNKRVTRASARRSAERHSDDETNKADSKPADKPDKAKAGVKVEKSDGQATEPTYANARSGSGKHSDSAAPASEPSLDDDFALAARLQQEWQAASLGDSVLAARLQHDIDAEEKQLAAQQAELLANLQRSFRCSICMDEHPEDDVARLSECGHAFCRDCLRGWILSRIEEHRHPILCPVCVTQSEGGTDPGVVSDAMVQQIGIPEKDYQVFEEMQLASFSIMLHCRG
ncbi:hypothetical protein HGRIS_003783 [Hohenbuehelia grisea]